jgi:hypothetical protein
MTAYTTTTQYVTTERGVVRRVFGESITCISLLRPGYKQHTNQGEIMPAAGGGWRAYGANRNLRNEVDLGVFVDFRDAEEALLSRKTGARSAMAWTGPRPAAPRKPAKRECGICGHPYTGERCERTELHWTAASIAAEEAARAARPRRPWGYAAAVEAGQPVVMAA